MDLQEQILPCLGNNVLLKVETTHAHAQPAETGAIFPFLQRRRLQRGGCGAPGLRYSSP